MKAESGSDQWYSWSSAPDGDSLVLQLPLSMQGVGRVQQSAYRNAAGEHSDVGTRVSPKVPFQVHRSRHQVVLTLVCTFFTCKRQASGRPWQSPARLTQRVRRPIHIAVPRLLRQRFVRHVAFGHQHDDCTTVRVLSWHRES